MNRLASNKNFKLNSRILCLIFSCSIILLNSCSTRKTEITIVGYDKKYIEIYNGNQTILRDSINSSPITGVGRILTHQVKFSDSILVITKFYDGDSLMNKVKLRKCPFIIIEHSSLDLKIYGTHKRRKFL